MSEREPGQYWVIVAEGDEPEVARWDGYDWFTHREPDRHHDYAVIERRVFRVGPAATPPSEQWVEDIPDDKADHPRMSISDMVHATLTNADVSRRLAENMTRNNALLRHLSKTEIEDAP